MPEQMWTQAYAGWPEAGRAYLQAAEAAYNKGASDAQRKVFPSYAAHGSWSEEDAGRLSFVYACAWNANSILGSAAKNQKETDSANDRKRAYKVETGRAITKGLSAGHLPLMPGYAPLDVWYDGKEISYLKALRKTYQDAYIKGRTLFTAAHTSRADARVRRIVWHRRGS